MRKYGWKCNDLYAGIIAQTRARVIPILNTRETLQRNEEPKRDVLRASKCFQSEELFTSFWTSFSNETVLQEKIEMSLMQIYVRSSPNFVVKSFLRCWLSLFLVYQIVNEFEKTTYTCTYLCVYVCMSRLEYIINALIVQFTKKL